MIPVLAIVRIRDAKGGFSIWAPLFLLWPLMAVLALILAPFWSIYVLARGRNPAALAGGICGLIFSLRGARVEVESPAASVLVRVI
jgi:hypothetical protein